MINCDVILIMCFYESLVYAVVAVLSFLSDGQFVNVLNLIKMATVWNLCPKFNCSRAMRLLANAKLVILYDIVRINLF